MNSPAALFAARWLVRDTFRQSLANGIFWLMLTITGLCTLVCLSVDVSGEVPLRENESQPADFLPRSEQPRDGVPAVRGELTLMFGAVSIPLDRGREEAVRFLELQLAAWVADAAGLLLALIWTAGFLPSFLEPSAASVLLAKPMPRWYLLAAKYLGVLVFVGAQTTLFITATWLALAVRTGVWDGTYLLCIPLLVVQFAVFFSFSTLLAVSTRSTVACVFGSLMFWFLCWGMNYGRHAVVLQPAFEAMSPLFRSMVDGAYWVLPKPADLSMILFEKLQADNYFGDLMGIKTLKDAGAFQPDASLISSILFAVGIVAVSARQLETTEY